MTQRIVDELPTEPSKLSQREKLLETPKAEQKEDQKHLDSLTQVLLDIRLQRYFSEDRYDDI